MTAGHSDHSLTPATRRLLTVRALRAVGQGALIVSFTLYLKALGWRGGSIGLLLSGGGLLNGGLSVLFGLLSDRVGSRRFLLAYQAVILVVSSAAILVSQPELLAAAAIVGGFGRGQTGAAGPFAPAESAWLAESLPALRRGEVYSINAALGFFGMAVGAAMAAAMPLWRHLLPGPLAFRPLFVPTAAGALAGGLVLLQTPGGGPRSDRSRGRTREPAPRRLRDGDRAPSAPDHMPPEGSSEERTNWKPLALLTLTNGFNGLAISMTNPLIAYWFNARFHVGTGTIGWLFLLAFIATGIASLAVGRLTRTFGLIQSVVVGRSIGLGLFVALPLVPVYWMASLIYIVRSALNRGTAGARQAVVLGMVAERQRAFGISLNNVSMQLPAAVGPTIGGYLIQEGQLGAPFFIASALQAVYLVLYVRLFKRFDVRPENRAEEDRGPIESAGSPPDS